MTTCLTGLPIILAPNISLTLTPKELRKCFYTISPMCCTTSYSKACDVLHGILRQDTDPLIQWQEIHVSHDPPRFVGGTAMARQWAGASLPLTNLDRSRVSSRSDVQISLLNEFGYHPLAVAQAGAYIHKRKLGTLWIFRSFPVQEIYHIGRRVLSILLQRKNMGVRGSESTVSRRIRRVTVRSISCSIFRRHLETRQKIQQNL